MPKSNKARGSTAYIREVNDYGPNALKPIGIRNAGFGVDPLANRGVPPRPHTVNKDSNQSDDNTRNMGHDAWLGS